MMVRELREVVYSHRRMKQLLSFVSIKGKSMVPPYTHPVPAFQNLFGILKHKPKVVIKERKSKQTPLTIYFSKPTFGSILILYKMNVEKRIILMSSFTSKCPRAEIIEGVLAEVFLSSVTLDHCAVCSCAIIKGSLCLEGHPPFPALLQKS